MLFWSVVFVLNLAAAVVIIFFERKNPAVAAAWLLVFLVLPAFGLLLYLFLGLDFPNKYKRIIKDLKKDSGYLNGILKRQLEILTSDANLQQAPEVEQCADMIYMNLRQSFSFFMPANAVQVYTEGRKMFDDLFYDLSRASSSINVEYFIFKPDSTGKAFLDILVKKAEAGVKVRLLYDMFGFLGLKKSFFSPLIAAGGQVRPFLPHLFSNLLHANYRNHRKIVVIDGKIAYTGGMNVGDEYNSRWKEDRTWRDTHLKVCGPGVYMFQTRFLMDWKLCTGKGFDIKSGRLANYFPPIPACGRIPIQVVSSGPDADDHFIELAYIKLIHKAAHTLYIQTPYFIPDDVFLSAIKVAAASGVDVRVMVPDKGDRAYVHYATLSYVEDLLNCGVRVYFYHGFLHAKTMVTDQLITSVGSANLDVRSLCINFEINTFLYDAAFAEKYTGIFLEDIQNCTEMTRELYAKRPWYRRAVESVCRLFSPIM